MKCPRCGAEMKRRKFKEHSFQYSCPKCGLVIGNNTAADTETAQNEEEESASL